MSVLWLSCCGTCDHRSMHRWQLTACVRNVVHSVFNPDHANLVGDIRSKSLTVDELKQKADGIDFAALIETDHWPKDNYCPHCLRGWDDDESVPDACPHQPEVDE